MSYAPDVYELFSKSRKQYEASTAAQIGGGVAGVAGATAAGYGVEHYGQYARHAAGRARDVKAYREAKQTMELGRKLKSPKAAGIAAGVGALAGTAATFREKGVKKSFDTADEVFDEVAKFERETTQGIKHGAAFGAGAIGGFRAVGAAAQGAKAGRSGRARAIGALTAGSAAALQGAKKGAIYGGATGGLLGASEARTRIKDKGISRSYKEEEEIGKFARETKRAAKKGAIGAGYIGGALGLARGVGAGAAIGGVKTAAKMGAATGAVKGVKWAALGGIGGAAVGASQAHDRKKKQS